MDNSTIIKIDNIKTDQNQDLEQILIEKTRELELVREQLQMEISERELVEEALRESSKRFRNIAFSIEGWIWEMDQKGVYTYCSEKVRDILGYSVEELHGKHFLDLVAKDEFKRIQSIFTGISESRKSIEDLEVWYQCKNRDKVCLLCNGVPVLDSNDELIGYRGVNKDITYRKRVEDNLNQLNKELQRSNHELERYAYVASHDLQEPLRMITSYLQLISRRYKSKLSPEADEFIDYAVDGANRMKQLIQDLLAYSRISTQGSPFESTDCRQIMDQLLIDLKVAIHENRARIICESLPAVYADPLQLKQLFQNLIGNAIKFKGDSLPEIYIKAKRRNREWVFSIRDNGIGIDPECGEQIFEIFQRLHGKEEYPGTGIGLSICQKIVERHKGRIWYDSEPGCGTTFNFTIPFEERCEF